MRSLYFSLYQAPSTVELKAMTVKASAATHKGLSVRTCESRTLIDAGPFVVILHQP